jgi:peptidoglycan/xylan/chitin deacetylase (PgdA/CDA1 family)
MRRRFKRWTIMYEMQIHDFREFLGQIQTVPNQIEKPCNLSTSAAEIESYALNACDNNGSNIDLHANKVIFINFGDLYKCQFTYVKPILDRYGFKATFF